MSHYLRSARRVPIERLVQSARRYTASGFSTRGEGGLAGPVIGNAVSKCYGRFSDTLVLSARTCLDLPKRHRHSQAEEEELLHFPGAKTTFTPSLAYVNEISFKPVPCYRLLNDHGEPIDGAELPEVGQSLGVKIYETMVTLRTMDNLFYEAQRQGRISFYVTSIGEEAINVASAAALGSDDLIFPQYREQGVLLWRGFTLNDFCSQCFGNEADNGKGRQMPVHYGSKKLNYVTVSSTVGTQLPHAVGAAYALKMDKEEACTVTYFGEGGTSEGDFHAAMNFASVLEIPVLFICRNNGWAVSTPASDQYRSDGVVVKGQAYGMRSFRVDGNDALAVYSCVKAARKMAIEESRPILVEALTYRLGHHTTSDDSSRYRSITEMEQWRSLRDPVIRFRKWLEGNAWWDEVAERKFHATARNEVITAMVRAENLKKPPLSDLFKDVYDYVPSHLREQEIFVRSTVARHPKDYPSDVPL